MSARTRGLLIGVLAAALAGYVAHRFALAPAAVWTAAVTALCAAWWILEPISIPATSLIPFAVFPLTGVLDHKTVAASYGHTLILLLMGGFMLSRAVEKSRVHRRLALGMVQLTGGGGRRLVLGFMLASALCSMWISNTATVLMLLPVALAVLEDEGAGNDLAVPLLLGIAYAASIGGMATPVGTPPNVIFMGIYQQQTGQDVSFLRWMSIGIPAVIVLLPLAWLHLTRHVSTHASRKFVLLGPWTPAEVRVLVVFAITAAAWIFRAEPLGGWSHLLGISGASDSTVALAAVVIMFLVPSGKGDALLDWDMARTIPWGLLLLFGGGIAISAGFQASGLSDALGQALGRVAGWHIILVTAIICVSVTFLTEVTSNTATTNLLMPVLAAAAAAAHIEPMTLMVPATLSASCAFMLPVATAPNAIVSGTDYITTRHMVRHGVALNFIGAIALTVVCVLFL